MKKTSVLFLFVFSVILALTGCGQSNDSQAQTTGVKSDAQSISNESSSEEKTEVTSNTLVVYFSVTGTTKTLAEYASEVLNVDIYEIVPNEPYTEADIAYNTDCRANREQNDPASRPEISGNIADISKYDTIVLGYPIWHGQAPRIISTFLESYDFADKTIVPFCTSHSSGIGNSATNLHSICADSAKWKDGTRFASGTTKEEIKAWLDGLGLSSNTKPSLVSQFALTEGVNGTAPSGKLNSGYEMPIAGIGTYSLLDEECVNAISTALQSGVRLIDTAYMYHNEEAVGEGIRQSGISREDVFVTTKLYPSQFSDASQAIDDALQKLGVDYIDLMLLHHPGNGDVEAYKAMEQAVAEGKIRSIGLSNWYIEEIDNFLPQVTITPAVVQNEIHPYYQESAVIDYMHSLGIVMEGWYPLGGRGHTQELLNDETIAAIANAHDRSSAQVILRWNLQKGVVVIPGSSNPEHIKENISLFDFELSDDEMAQINALNRDEKHDWY